MPTNDQCETHRKGIYKAIDCVRIKIVGWRTVGLLVTIVMGVVGVIGIYTYSCSTDTEGRVRSVERAHGETATKLDALSASFLDFRGEQRGKNKEILQAIRDLDRKIETAKDK